MSVQVRRILPGEWAELRALRLRALPTGRLGGLARGAAWHGEPEIAGVFSMWVDPGLRRRGAGVALLASVATWARDGGYARLRLHVVETNRGAVELYEGAGFVATGAREPLREGSDLTLLLMERDP